MKKTLSILAILAILCASMFALTGCGSDNKEKKANTTDISYINGKGKITIAVPKKEDGTPKYEFTTEKPEKSKFRGTFYLETDNAVLVFSTSGLVYNTAKDYKEKFGDVKATFDGYLEWMDNPDSTIPKNNTEKLEINGRKAVKRPSREGSSGNYKYYGYSYMIAVDDVYPGSYLELKVGYKTDEEYTEAKPLNEETQSIIDSLVISQNN